MKVNIIFPEVVKAYSVTKFDVSLNKEFDIELVDTDESTLLKWFANNDDILAIKVAPDGYSAKVKATSKGVCEIQIQNSQTQIQETLSIEVYDNVVVSLNPVVSQPQLK